MSLTVVGGRKLGDDILTMAASGWTYDFTFVLYDYESESMWFPLVNNTGQTQFTAITGIHKDKKMPFINSTTTTWNIWFDQHPDTKFLDVSSN